MRQTPNKSLEIHLEHLRQNGTWYEATTYADFAPHEYVRRQELSPAGQARFNQVVALIRENGVREVFYGRWYTYYYYKGQKYWTMGAPVDDTTILNRAVSQNGAADE